MIRRPPRSPLFPSTTLFRSAVCCPPSPASHCGLASPAAARSRCPVPPAPTTSLAHRNSVAGPGACLLSVCWCCCCCLYSPPSSPGENSENGAYVCHVVPEAYRRELAKGFHAAIVAKALREHDHLNGELGRLAYLERLPGLGHQRVYRIRSSIIAEYWWVTAGLAGTIPLSRFAPWNYLSPSARLAADPIRVQRVRAGFAQHEGGGLTRRAPHARPATPNPNLWHLAPARSPVGRLDRVRQP